MLQEIKKDRVFLVDDASQGKRMIVKIDVLDAAQRPGKAKGIAKGDALAESARMEQAFAVMKDYRFFKLCLPAVYGMGRYKDAFDFVLFKQYDGEHFAWSEYDDQPKILGGSAIPVSSAGSIAMMIFDLTLVPVLKFSKKVPTRNYPERVRQLSEEASAAIDKGLITRTAVDARVQEWLAFFDQKKPTLYCIQNGDFYPRNFLQLAESIVLLDWESALISSVEEVIAYEHVLMWGNPAWQERFLKEARSLIDVNEEWLEQMIRFCALKQLSFWAGITDEKAEKLQTGLQAMRAYV